jgi:hypothetical protein
MTVAQHWRTAEVLELVAAERDRQRVKWATPHGWGRGDCSTLDPPDDRVKLAVLAEEFGEVARALLEHDRDGLAAELVQVAAVCVAWLEAVLPNE